MIAWTPFPAIHFKCLSTLGYLSWSDWSTLVNGTSDQPPFSPLNSTAKPQARQHRRCGHEGHQTQDPECGRSHEKLPSWDHSDMPELPAQGSNGRQRASASIFTSFLDTVAINSKQTKSNMNQTKVLKSSNLLKPGKYPADIQSVRPSLLESLSHHASHAPARWELRMRGHRYRGFRSKSRDIRRSGQLNEGLGAFSFAFNLRVQRHQGRIHHITSI